MDFLALVFEFLLLEILVLAFLRNALAILRLCSWGRHPEYRYSPPRQQRVGWRGDYRQRVNQITSEPCAGEKYGR